jgi:hypothetical protein
MDAQLQEQLETLIQIREQLDSLRSHIDSLEAQEKRLGKEIAYPIFRKNVGLLYSERVCLKGRWWRFSLDFDYGSRVFLTPEDE